MSSRLHKADAGDAGSSALQARCSERASRALSDSNTKAGEGNETLTKYLFDFTQGEHLPEAAREHWTLKAKWIQERKLFLESTELPTRLKEASAALDTARSIFRNDVAVHINERLEWLAATFDRMNEALRTAPPFTNGERYLFKRAPRPQYAALHKFILDVAQYGPSDDLLGGAGDVPPGVRPADARPDRSRRQGNDLAAGRLPRVLRVRCPDPARGIPSPASAARSACSASAWVRVQVVSTARRCT